MYTQEIIMLNVGWILLAFSLGSLISLMFTNKTRYLLAGLIAIFSWFFMRVCYYAGGLGIALDNQPLTTDPGLGFTFLFRIITGIGAFSFDSIFPFQVHAEAILTGIAAGVLIFAVIWGLVILVINSRKSKSSYEIKEEMNSLEIQDRERLMVNKINVPLITLSIVGLLIMSLSVVALSGPLKPIPLTDMELQKVSTEKLPWSPLDVWSNMKQEKIPYVGYIDISKEAKVEQISPNELGSINFLSMQHGIMGETVIVVLTQYGAEGQFAKMGNELSLNKHQLEQLSNQYKSDVIKELHQDSSLLDWHFPRIVSINGMSAIWISYRIQYSLESTIDRKPITYWCFIIPNNNREHTLLIGFREYDLASWYEMSRSLNTFRITNIQ